MPDEDEILQDDGWIRVTSKKGAPQRFVSGVPRPDKEATLDTLTALLQKKTDLWRRSTCRKEVHKALERHRPDDGWTFDKALCLATGSFSREQGELINRTMFQLAVFLDTVNHLSGVSSISIPMYAQDPKYTDLDREFLTTLHVETSQMNLADIEFGLTQVKEHMGPNTLLFEFYMDMGWDSIRDIIEADTLLYIGTAFQDRKLINAPQHKRNMSDEFRYVTVSIEDHRSQITNKLFT